MEERGDWEYANCSGRKFVVAVVEIELGIVAAS